MGTPLIEASAIAASIHDAVAQSGQRLMMQTHNYVSSRNAPD
jgi:hypothetical protein